MKKRAYMARFFFLFVFLRKLRHFARPQQFEVGQLPLRLKLPD
jgi:hypothetical protein